MDKIILKVVNDEILFFKNGEQVYLTEDGEAGIATIIMYHEFLDLFSNEDFKDCPDSLLDCFNQVKKDYEALGAKLMVEK